MEIKNLANKLEALIKNLENLGVGYEHIHDLNTILNIIHNLPSLLPFKVGDRVSLNKEIDFNKAWGWKHYRDFLYVGSPGEITEIQVNTSAVRYLVRFDEDTSRYPKATFSLVAESLKLLEAKEEAQEENIYGDLLW